MGLSARAQFKPRGDLGQFVKASVAPAVKASVQASCELIETAAKGYAPVDTGALRESIHTTIDDSGATVVGTVSVGVPYGSYVEFGTGRKGDADVPHTDKPGMAASPYLRPAYDESKGAIKDLFANQIATAIKS